jgi:environmental stress-induced protein Ves
VTTTLIPFASLSESRWRNGAGRKADIATGPDWLVGFAWLEADAPFSDYRGHDRTITLVDGPGFTLDFGRSHPALVARQRYVPFSFDGGWPARCRVPSGSSLVLNTMTARAAWKHQVILASTTSTMEVSPGGLSFLVVLEGRVTIAGQTAGPRDTFRIEGKTDVADVAAAAAALIRINPHRAR